MAMGEQKTSRSDRQSLIVRLKQGLYDGSDIMRARCMLRQDGERITELQEEVERLRQENTDLREDYKDAMSGTWRVAAQQAETRLNRLVERLLEKLPKYSTNEVKDEYGDDPSVMWYSEYELQAAIAEAQKETERMQT
jgi:dsDNA-specific endonuclease/ATPase MutS2